MAKIVAFTLGVSGHLYPFVPILHALQRRGHAVTLALGSFAPRSQTMATQTFAQMAVVHVQLPTAQAGAVPAVPRRIAWQQNIETRCEREQYAHIALGPSPPSAL